MIKLGYYKVYFLASAATFISLNFGMAYDLKDYYPLGDGDRWTYIATMTNGKTDYYKRTVEVSGKEVIGDVETMKLTYSDDENECLVSDPEGVKRYKFFSENTFEVFNTPEMLYPNNLNVGETREYAFASEQTRNKGGSAGEVESQDPRTGTMKVTLEAIEDVELPAGKFTDCLKFSSVMNWKGMGAGDYAEEKCTTWLAPGVGAIKESCDVREYDTDSNAEEKFTESFELVGATVDGKVVGNQ